MDLVLNNWGGPCTAGFVANADGFVSGHVDQEELDRVLNNLGSTTFPNLAASNVLEPVAALGLALAVIGVRRRR